MIKSFFCDAKIKKINQSEVKKLRNTNCEYLVLQGCGGDYDEWIDGITNTLKDNGIVPDSFSFDEIYLFEKDGVTNIAFALNNKSIDISKLAMFRLKIRNEFGAMWLSDYIDNYLKDVREVNKKPKAPIVGADGNVFNLIGICSQALKRVGYYDQAKEMTNRVTNSHSYEDALSIMLEYIEPVDQNGRTFEEIEEFDEDISI